MKSGLKDRVAFWLEQFRALRPLLLQYDGEGPNGGVRYVNRLNGHVVVITRSGELR